MKDGYWLDEKNNIWSFELRFYSHLLHICSLIAERDGNSIKVVVRVRPPLKEEPKLCVEADGASDQVVLHLGPKSKKIFSYDHVADIDVTQVNMHWRYDRRDLGKRVFMFMFYVFQVSVFNSIGKSIIDSCFDGYNGTIFA